MARRMAPLRPARCRDSFELPPRAPTWAATNLSMDRVRQMRRFSADPCPNSLDSMTVTPHEVASLPATDRYYPLMLDDPHQPALMANYLRGAINRPSVSSVPCNRSRCGYFSPSW